MADAPIPPPVVIAAVDTSSHAEMPQHLVAETPGTAPNVVVQFVGPVMAILIRLINNYLTMLVGLIAAGTADGKLIPATDFVDMVLKCAQLAVAGAGLAFLKDLVTIFGKLESKYPLWTGNV